MNRVESDAVRLTFEDIMSSLPGGVVGHVWQRENLVRLGLSASRLVKPFIEREARLPETIDGYEELFREMREWAFDAAMAWCEYPERFERPPIT